MKPLNEIFEVTYGNKLDLNKLARLDREAGGINFVGRSSQNHGVSGTVAPIPGLDPYPSGLITVALGGSKLLSAFVQDGPFYTAQNVAVLRPLSDLSHQQKLYTCLVIRQNRFRYSAFGREANRTLRTLLVPDIDQFPDWIDDYDQSVIGKREKAADGGGKIVSLDCVDWKPFTYSDLFDIRKGQRLTKANMIPGCVPFVGASDRHNGVTTLIGQTPNHSGNTITVSYNGSVAEAFYQDAPYWASDDVNVLYGKAFQINPQIGLFICTLIKKEKYRFSYGRKWHLERMKQSIIRLPVDKSGKPDTDFMERFVNSLSYSSQIRAS